MIMQPIFKKTKNLSVLFLLFTFSTSVTAENSDYRKEIRWNWSKEKINDLNFPEGFLWGTATCTHQDSGTDKSNWSEWEKGSHSDGKPHINRGEKCGVACDSWNLYKKDIEIMKQLGVNSYRFSIDWSRIEPEMGKFSEDAINHYSEILDALIAENIIPMATLHHFVHPLWFEKMGAFEKEENIKYFVRFSKLVFEKFASKIPYWCTINEPNVLVFQGYMRGVTPPGKENLQLAGTVLKNLLLAHIQVYKELKAMPACNKAQIGLVHNVLQFEPFHKYNLLESLVSKYISHVVYDEVVKFFKTGKFNFSIPFKVHVEFNYEKPHKTLDFFGLNYYSHVLLNIPKGSDARENDTWTDMEYTIYAEGFYRAIQQVAEIKDDSGKQIPIICTENGIADKNNYRRIIWIKKYLYALSKAIKDGYDIRGYYYWSLLDNFEWDYGFAPKFGLAEVDPLTLERKLKPSAKAYSDIIRKFSTTNN